MSITLTTYLIEKNRHVAVTVFSQEAQFPSSSEKSTKHFPVLGDQPSYSILHVAYLHPMKRIYFLLLHYIFTDFFRINIPT